MAKRSAAAGDDDSPDPKRRNKENSSPNGGDMPPCSPGIIKSVYVENFMCHRKLQVDLCRNVNFIHGQNGSGKSAILAALQICLGASAKRTNRAGNLKGLVRHDPASGGGTVTCARVRVTLVNTADDGYKYDEYGDSIAVERTISKTGSGFNGYKLLGADGKEKSRNKKDLDELLDVLNIQVENPVAVLDQEEAKKFLTGKAEDKYKFFNKATELERVDRVYAITIDQINELNISKEKIANSLTRAQDNVNELKQKHDEHQKVNELIIREAKLTASYGWARYQEELGTLEQTKTDAAQFQQQHEKKVSELEALEEAAQCPEDANKAHTERTQRLADEVQEIQTLKRQMEQQVKEVLQPQKTRIHQLHTAGRQVESSRQALLSAQKRLKQARDEIVAKAGNAQAQAAERTVALQRAEEDLHSRREKVKPLQEAMSQARQEYEKVEPYIQDAKSNVKRVESQLNGVKQTIQQLEDSAGNDMAIFGRRVPKLLGLISQTRFDGPVVGPVGKFIKVVPGKEDFVALAQQAVGGGNMDRFIVTTSSDRVKLNQLRRKAGCQLDCGIFQATPGHRHQIPRPPVDGVETVASVLDIQNDLVFNCLVDQARIESKALCRDKNESEQQLLTRDGSGKQVIRGAISEVYCMPAGDRWTCKKGVLSIISNERRNNNVVIGVDKSRAIRQAKAEEEGLKNELRQYKQNENRLEKQHSDHQKDWSRGKRQVYENDKEIEVLQEKISTLRDEIDTTADTSIDTSGFEDNVAEAEQAVQDAMEAKADLERKIEEGKPEVEARKAKLRETKERVTKVLQDLDAAQEEMTQFLDTQSQRDQEIEKKRKKVEKGKDTLKKAEQTIEEQEGKCELVLRKAKKLEFTFNVKEKRHRPGQAECEVTMAEGSQEATVDPTPDDLSQIEIQAVDRDSSYYQARVTKARERIAIEREKRKISNEDPVAVYQKYIRARKALQGKMEQIQEIDGKVDELNADMLARQKRFRQFRSHLSRKTNTEFNKILAMNNFSGQAEFDHKSGTLDLVVSKESGGTTQTKDVKALSGGERSYTTMSLLIAMGENLETPFRVLDEFDVFLDAQSRKLTINILIHVAKKLAHRQFIFITPQDLSSLTPDSQLKIMKLHPPARRQTAGGPSQQTLNFTQEE